MGKIQDCAKCENYMGWSLPENVIAENYEYALRCVKIAKTTFVCSYTMKTKEIGHKQQCRHFVDDAAWQEKIQAGLAKDVEELEQKISDYEKQLQR